MRSVVVVLPASMCAMIPMLRVRASGNSLMMGMLLSSRARRSWSGVTARRSAGRRPAATAPALPAVVSEGLVGLRHLVRVLPALDRGADSVGGVQQLVGQAQCHGLFPALAG